MFSGFVFFNVVFIVFAALTITYMNLTWEMVLLAIIYYIYYVDQTKSLKRNRDCNNCHLPLTYK